MSVTHPSATKVSFRQRGGSSTLPALLLGIPLATGILCFIHRGPIQDPTLKRYVQHPVECVEVILFCCALGALAAKLFRNFMERRAFRHNILPAWDGQRVHALQATDLMAHVGRSAGSKSSSLARRVAAILDFVCSRGSAVELDDQMRALADGDAIALENSNALLRFITWAIPILGFLGTVLGITQAISGVTPEKLEHSLSTVTDGLAEAFDSTALALGLTMLTMFLTFLVDRAEQATIEAVDAFVEMHLAHRFERPGSGSLSISDELRQDLNKLTEANERLVEHQAETWAKTLQTMHQRMMAVEKNQQEGFVQALEIAMQKTLASHENRLGALEKQVLERSSGLVKHMDELAGSLREAGREQQKALQQLGDKVVAQAGVFAQLQENEKHLFRLQELLNHNLRALAETGTFEQALLSLTAAMHLFTARAGSSTAASALPRAAA